MLAKMPKRANSKPEEYAKKIMDAIADEEWSKWRLIMAEDCSITFKDLFDRAMDDLDISVANAALNRAMREKKKASNGKK